MLEAKAERKKIVLPWWWQYLSLVVFMGIIVASMLDIKLKVSCVIGCIVVVLLQLSSSKELAKELPVEIYLLIAFSFPLGIGMKESGVSDVLGALLAEANLRGFPLLLLIGSVTLVLTNTITNQGSAQVLLPLVVNVYNIQGTPPMAGIVMLATMLCCALCTPFAIPANAIVMQPGGYRAKDYIKFGLPLSVIVIFTAAPLVATFYHAW